MNEATQLTNQKYEAGDHLNLQDAAKLLAAHDTRPYEKERQAIDRWRQRITTAVRKGQLSEQRRTFEICELTSWAVQLKVKDAPDWPLRLKGLPRNSQEEAVSVQAIAADSIHDLVLPGDLKRCHAEIRRLTIEANALRQELSCLHSEADVLRPKAEQYDRICEQNQASGRMRKKP